MADKKKNLTKDAIDEKQTDSENLDQEDENSNSSEEQTDSDQTSSDNTKEEQEETSNESNDIKEDKKETKQTSSQKKAAKRHKKKAAKKQAQLTHKKSADKVDTAEDKKGPKTKIWLYALLAVVLIANIVLVMQMIGFFSTKAPNNNAPETIVPKVQITTLTNSKCLDCYDVTELVTAVKGLNINVTAENSVEYDSEAGLALVKKYGLTKVPTIVVKGEVSNLTIPKFEKKDDALVLLETLAPYTDVATGQVKGLIKLTYLKASDCTNCQDLNVIITQFEGFGMKFTEKNEVEVTSNAGLALVEKYNITKVPTLIFSNDINYYDQVAQAWPVIGTIEQDGSFIMRTPQAIGVPYLDLTTNKVEGLVDLTYLSDKSCTTCYNVSVHKAILERFGMKFSSETYVDISDNIGKALIAKYNITQVPTVVISKEASIYPGLQQVWPSVGSIEKDGSYIFRNPGLMSGSVFKDLSTGQIIGKPAAQGTVDVGQ